MLNEINYLETNITAKLRFPSSLTSNYWAIEDVSEKKLYAVPFIGALMIVACAKPITKSALFEFLFSKVQAKTQQLENVLKNLISKKIILTPDNKANFLPLIDNFSNWIKAGWQDAANYHFFTWDAPFLDYTKEGEGHDIDRKKMIGYQSLQPDTQRYKTYDIQLQNIPLPSINFSFSTEQLQSYTVSQRINLLLSFAFGKNGEKPCHWIDVPLIRRTSPSGGCRHPTEGYFLSMNLKDIQNGFYHIQTDPISLCFLSSSEPSILEDTIKENSIDSPALGAIILTSIFERNMYRYREPRTFRTIHMDIGHILATIEMLSKELKLTTCIHLNFSEDTILKQINASKFDEGVMAIVTLHEEIC